MNKGSYLYGVTILVHNQNLSIMTPNTFRIIKNSYIAYAIVYVILCIVGGSIYMSEWDANGWLGAIMAAVVRLHLHLENPTEF